MVLGVFGCVYLLKWNSRSSTSRIHPAPLCGIDERARKTSVIKFLRPEAIHCSPRSKHCPFPRPKRPARGSHVTSWIGGTSQVAGCGWVLWCFDFDSTKHDLSNLSIGCNCVHVKGIRSRYPRAPEGGELLHNPSQIPEGPNPKNGGAMVLNENAKYAGL